MVLRRVLLAVLVTVGASGIASAQIQDQNLRDLLTGFIAQGITLAPSNTCGQVPTPPTCHIAHFEGNAIAKQVQAFQAVNTSIGQQLANFPLPSSSGGFTYTYDPQKGTFTRGAESFGPVYSERADTVGKGRFNLGINYSHFSYDQINDINLKDNSIPILFLHLPGNPAALLEPWFRGDVVEGTLSLTAKSDITAFVANYGITDRFDVGLAIPLVSTSLDAQTHLSIDRLSTSAPDEEDIHQFDCTQPGVMNCSANSAVLTTSGSATGLGDVVMRLKYRVTESSNLGAALGTDFRFPTGKEEDLLGTGVMQIRAFLIASGHFGVFSPHINAGYTWAIHRCQGLADPPGSTDSPRDQCRTTGRGGLSDEVNYTGGFDIAFGSRVTFVADVIGRTYLRTNVVSELVQPLRYNTNSSCTDPATCPGDIHETARPYIGVQSSTGDINSLTGSVGFKVNPFGNFLITVNGLFALNNNGLVDKFTPMFGIDYAF